MRIGIDWTPAESGTHEVRTGIGQYTLHCIRHLIELPTTNEFFLFCNNPTMVDGDIRSHSRVAKICRWPQKKFPLISSHVERSQFLKWQKLDIYHQTGGNLPVFYNGCSVLTVHDLGIFFHPEWFPKGQWWSRNILYPRSLQCANQMIAVSETTKKDLVERFHVKSKKINVIYHGAALTEREGTKPKTSISQPYILTIGTFEPRKNFISLVEAFESLQRHNLFQRFNLVLVGIKGWKCDALINRVLHSPYKKNIHWLQAASETEKKWLLANATVFVYPSLYEGFGLPIIEAMSMGVPVICSDAPALVEIGGKAVEYVVPNSRKIELALRSLLGDIKKQKQLSQLGRKRAREFSWKKTAQQTLQVYERTVG